jgi:hypothetical protein
LFRSSRRRSSEDGSAVIDFLAFGVPTLLVSLIVLQLLLAGYVRNVALDAAAEGAAQAAAADGTLEMGASRATQVMKAAAPWFDFRVFATDGVVDSQAASLVTVNVHPGFVWLGQATITSSEWCINETRN